MRSYLIAIGVCFVAGLAVGSDSQLRSSTPKDLAWRYNNSAVEKSNAGDIAGALHDYDKALQTAILPEAYSNRALLKVETGDYSGALKDADIAMSMDCSLPFARGRARFAVGDTKGAIADFDKTIELFPDLDLAYECRGLARLTLGDEVGGFSDYCVAAQDYLFLGRNEERLFPQAALQMYANAIRLNPGFKDAFIQRGFLFKTLGNKEAAKSDFEMAALLDPHDDIVKKALSTLED